MQRYLVALALAALVTTGRQAAAVVYYVSTAGSDANPGTQTQPWQTIQQAANTAVAADTVLVQPGIYDEAVMLSTTASAGSPLTFRANGAVTNRGSWVLQSGAAYIVIDGFHADASGAHTYYTPFYFKDASGISNISVINCKIHDIPNIYPRACIDWNNPLANTVSSCLFSNNSIYNFSTIAISLKGIGHLVVNNWLSNSMGSDAFNVFGHDHVIRGNYCTQIGSRYGQVEHPDFIQTFGPLSSPTQPMWGLESYNILVENNMDIDPANGGGGAIGQLTADNGTGASTVHDWTFRNNVFVNIDLGASIDIVRCKWFNNTFYQCAPSSGCLGYGWFDPNGADPRGQAYGGSVSNNAFIACAYLTGNPGAYSGVAANGYVPNPPIDLYANCDYNFVCRTNFGPEAAASSYPTTDPFRFYEPHGINGGNPQLANAASGDCHLTLGSILIGRGVNLSSMFASDADGNARPVSGAWDIGAYEYQSGPPGAPAIVSQPQNLTANVGAAISFSVTATGTAPLTFQWTFNGAAIPGATASTLSLSSLQSANAGAYAVVVSNPVGAVTSATATLTVMLTAVAPAITSPPGSLTLGVGATATFSVAATGTVPLSYQWSFNGASIAGATASAFTLSNIQVTETGNYSVTVSNPAGVANSSNAALTVTNPVVVISDPSLKLWLNFDQGPFGARIPDLSGNGNDAWQFDASNWITATNGVFGGTAAQFTYVGFMNNDPPNIYPLSQYLAVTNLNGFASLTKGTISFWARFDTNIDTVANILSNGYADMYAGNPTAASNSWAICRNETPYLTFVVYPAAVYDQQVVQWPDDTVRSGGSTPDLSTTSFHLYSMTVDCPSNRAIAYYDGQPYMTNSIGLPYLTVYGCATMPWLCIGAFAHDGTPQWGDDKYPNSGFFPGRLDDIRIYNRTLSALEIQKLYLAVNPVPPAPPSGLRVGPSN